MNLRLPIVSRTASPTARRARALSLLATALLIAAGPTPAQESGEEGSAAHPAGGTLNLLVGAALSHEDNLFHLPPGTDPQAALGKSSGTDTANIEYIGVTLDKSYSQQHFLLDARATHFHYNTFSFLDFSATKYQGSWQWTATHWLTGSLEANREQSLVNFADSLNYTQRNTRSARNENFNLDGELGGGWHLIGKTARFTRKDTHSIAAEGDFQETSNEAGVKYVETSSSSLAVVARTTSGEYTDRSDDPVTLRDKRYTQHDLELRGNWPITGKSTLLATLTHLARHHEHFAQRDYTGTGYQAAYKWNPTGKLKLEFGAKREIASYQEVSSSYAVDNALSATATWSVYPKTTVRLKAEEARRNFFGAVAPVADMRQDKFHSMQAGVEWAPLKYLTLTANLQHDRRNSNRTAYAYGATSSQLAAQLIF